MQSPHPKDLPPSQIETVKYSIELVTYMAIRLKTKIAKGSNGYMLRVPKTYVDDGNLILGQEYEVVLTRSGSNGGANEPSGTRTRDAVVSFAGGLPWRPAEAF